jgi:hypothetical protein
MSIQNDTEQIFCSNCGTKNIKGQKFCSDCGSALISSNAMPVESKPPKQKRGLLKGCLVGFGILFVLGICGIIALAITSGDSDTGTTSITNQPSTQTESSSSESAEPTVYIVGQDVEVGEVRWRIIEVIDEGQTLRSDNQFIDDKTTAGTFLRITFEMENLSNNLLSFTGMSLIDDQDRRFIASSDVLMFLETDKECIIIENLNPNVPRVCQSIYELPANATGVNAIVTNLRMLGAREAHVSLGLDE